MSDLPCIVRKPDGAVVARATRPDQVLELDGNWYFAPEAVDPTLLEITDRTYTCPYKGVCNWVDLKSGASVATDAAWVYPAPKPGFRRIAGWFGFYADHAAYRKTGCRAA
ncbi:MAG TPA: DUF427 domain-containing protein [Acidiferrobacterales bacterium]|jgi:uncharacterized protein (DUF427 family)